MAHRVEYLIIVDEREQFCKSISGFNSLLKTIEGLSINNRNLSFNNIQVKYEVQSGQIQKDNKRYFHAKFAIDDNSKINDFEILLRSIRSVLSKAGERPPQVLWDGISYDYANRAYPLLHEIENTLRKLITKFMLINVGLGWTREAIPREVQDSVRTKDSKLDHGYLYEVDFIQLENFLFKEYATINPNVIVERLKKVEKVEDLVLDDLKLAIPRSNWDRFFSKIVNCESEYLSVRWKKLYERRNQVAHNKQLSKTEYEEIVKLVDELHPKFNEAIDNLDKLNISENERELVFENVFTSKFENFRDFLSKWNEFYNSLSQLIYFHTKTKNNFSLEKNISFKKLILIAHQDLKLFTKEELKEAIEIYNMRNLITHEQSILISSSDIDFLIGRINKLLNSINTPKEISNK